jgi:hypothetical protein
LAQQYRKIGRVSLLPTAVLGAFWASLAGSVAAADYPPPPGPYHSDRSLHADMPAPSAVAPTVDGEGAVVEGHASSRMLPLSGNAPQGEPGRFDATNLFGSRPDAADPARHRRFRGAPEDPADTAPAPYPATSYPAQPRFPGEFNQGRPTFGPNYPQYAPAHPGYSPYPGRMMEYAPSYPGHAEQYAPVYPQAPAGSGDFTATESARGPYRGFDGVEPGYDATGHGLDEQITGGPFHPSSSSANAPPRDHAAPVVTNPNALFRPTGPASSR